MSDICHMHNRHDELIVYRHVTITLYHASALFIRVIIIQEFSSGRIPFPRYYHNHFTAPWTLSGTSPVSQCFDAVGWAAGRASGL